MVPGEIIYGVLSQAGTAAGARIYPLLLPQAPTYPAIRYQQISSVPEQVFGASAPVTRVRVQVDSYAMQYADARQLATQVRTALDRWSGTIGATTALDVRLDDESDEWEEGARISRVMQEYILVLRTN